MKRKLIFTQSSVPGAKFGGGLNERNGGFAGRGGEIGDFHETFVLAGAIEELVGIGESCAVDEGEEDLVFLDFDHADVAADGAEKRVVVEVAKDVEFDGFGGGGGGRENGFAECADELARGGGFGEEMLGKDGSGEARGFGFGGHAEEYSRVR